jgi:hypothetical protein
MIVAGGCYRELCEQPYWDSTLGSGGRAAAVLAAYSSGVKLQTYFRRTDLQSLYPIEAHGVAIDAAPREDNVTFSYLHPLATPHVIPEQPTISPPIRVDGSTVLRFGFIEGDSVVSAHRVVYDPQSLRPANFTSNGSRAAHLAVVLNQAELEQLGQSTDMGQAVQRLVQHDRAEVVVVKCGASGAWVFEPNAGSPTLVPAFRSQTVFKIGTGDVFSAVFAHHWCEKNELPAAAALAASKAVAFYAESRSLRISPMAPDPIAAKDARVSVIGFGSTLADVWLREETCSALLDLGVHLVHVPSGKNLSSVFNGSLLVLADGGLRSSSALIKRAVQAQVPTVVFQEKKKPLPPSTPNLRYTDDFCTAVYWAVWMSTGAQQESSPTAYASRRKRG